MRNYYQQLVNASTMIKAKLLHIQATGQTANKETNLKKIDLVIQHMYLRSLLSVLCTVKCYLSLMLQYNIC